MPKIDRGKWLHGYCALKVLGISGMVTLPKDEIGKVTLAEVGPEVMREICDRLAASS